MKLNGNILSVVCALIGLAPVAVPINVEKLMSEGAAQFALASSDARNPVPIPDGGCGIATICPACETLSMPPQYNCENPPLGWNCNIDPGGSKYRNERKRWKWKCPEEVTYISCGPWVALGCCATYDGGQSCAGNSGLSVCQGVPPS